jgi:hypothetical protein
LNDRVELSKWEIKKHINCQQAYINTKNPDFVDEISEALKECGSPENVGQESHQLKMMGG